MFISEIIVSQFEDAQFLKFCQSKFVQIPFKIVKVCDGGSSNRLKETLDVLFICWPVRLGLNTVKVKNLKLEDFNDQS